MAATAEKIKSIVARFTEYAGIRSQREALEKREGVLKKELNAAVEQYGFTDDVGHEYLAFPEPVAGFEGLKRERRCPKSLDFAKALELIKVKRVLGRCTSLTLPVANHSKAVKLLVEAGLLPAGYKVAPEDIAIDTDALEACVAEGKISDDEFDALWIWKINYAFIPQKTMPVEDVEE